MSPEQARGKSVDKRTDVWAFGCVLYEMLSGRRAFDGEDATEIISAVMKSEPEWSALPKEVPAHLLTIVTRCLVKDRKTRIPDLSVVRSYDLMILPIEGDAVSGRRPGTPIVFLSTKAGEAIPMFSPDGHWIAYTSNELGTYDVLVRPFPQKAGGPRRVSAGGGGWPFWSMTSPDLLFVTATNKVMVAPYSVAGDIFTSGPPQPWSPIGFQSAPLATQSPYALHPDGKRVLLAAAEAQDALETRDKLVFYIGFGEYLKKIAPVTKTVSLTSNRRLLCSRREERGR